MNHLADSCIVLAKEGHLQLLESGLCHLTISFRDRVLRDYKLDLREPKLSSIQV